MLTAAATSGEMACSHLDLGTLYVLPCASLTELSAMGSQYSPLLAKVAKAAAMVIGATSWPPMRKDGVVTSSSLPSAARCTPIRLAASRMSHRSSMAASATVAEFTDQVRPWLTVIVRW